MNAPTDTAEAKTAQKDSADERIAELEAKLAEMREMFVASQAAPAAEPIYEGTPVQEEKPRTTMTLRELRKYDGQLYVEHNDPQRQFSCHQAIGEHRVDFDLGPAGRPDAVGILPKLALEIRGIQRAWMRRTITISTDESMEEKIDLLMRQHASYSEETLAALQAPLQPSNNVRDLITRPCLRCGRFTRDQTGATSIVIQGGKSIMSYGDYKAGRAPLCDAHVNEEHLWVGTLIKDPQSGAQDWKFSSIVVGENQPGVPQQSLYTGPIMPQGMQQQFNSY